MKNSSVTDHSDKNTIINSKSDTNFNLTVSNLNEKANHKDFGLIPTASNKYAVKLGSGMRDSLPGIKKNRFGYLMVVKAYGSFIETDLRYMKDLIMTGNEQRVIPTGITTIIGYSHILRFIIDSQPYHSILKASGITSFQKHISSHLKVYYSYGEFLRYIMQISDLTKEVMKVRYPIVFKEAYDGIQLRMGGKLSDVPIPVQFLTMQSLNVAIQCIKKYSKSKNIYVASDSFTAKQFMKNNIHNKSVSFVNEKSLYSDVQLNNMEGVLIATYSAVADLYILGNSQQCIMTDESTFAYAACAISGKPPVIVPLKKQMCLESDSLIEL